jgi:hypothetical protein
MNILFIGGPMDGKRQPVPPDCHGMLRCYDTNLPPLARVTYADRLVIKEHTYHLTRLGSLQVMLHEDAPGVIEALIKGYHRHRAPSRYPRQRKMENSLGFGGAFP